MTDFFGTAQQPSDDSLFMSDLGTGFSTASPSFHGSAYLRLRIRFGSFSAVAVYFTKKEI